MGKEWTVGKWVTVLLAVILCGCGNPFGGEETGSRFTPEIEGLTVDRVSVYCDIVFEVSFDYRDNQGDIEFVHLLFMGEGGTVIDETLDWISSRVTLEKTSGKPDRAVVTCSFDCSRNDPEGRYVIQVKVEDKKGHVSNELRGEISLR
jgi:hypothetical protein